MPDLDLRALWKLHLIDRQLLDIRKRAAALDPGKKILGELAALNVENEAKAAHAKALAAEQLDIELQQRTIDEKLKKIDKDLYGGKVINPREVANLQHEITVLKGKRGDLDVRILELWEAIPPAQKLAEAAEAKVKEKKSELSGYQAKVQQAKSRLEQEFKERADQRPVLAKAVPAAMLSRYESIRQKHGGIGMTGISKKGTCEACGTLLPRKVVEYALEGKLVTCESCHRIIYASEGLI